MQPAYIGCGAAFTNEMKTCFLLFLAERTQWVINPPHYSKISIESVMSGKENGSIFNDHEWALIHSKACAIIRQRISQTRHKIEIQLLCNTNMQEFTHALLNGINSNDLEWLWMTSTRSITRPLYDRWSSCLTTQLLLTVTSLRLPVRWIFARRL